MGFESGEGTAWLVARQAISRLAGGPERHAVTRSLPAPDLTRSDAKRAGWEPRRGHGSSFAGCFSPGCAPKSAPERATAGCSATLPTSSRRWRASPTRKALQGQDTALGPPQLQRRGHAATGTKRCWLPAQVPRGVEPPCHQPPNQQWWHRGIQATSPPDTSPLSAYAGPAARTRLVFAHPLPAAHPEPLTNAIWQKGTTMSQRGVLDNGLQLHQGRFRLDIRKKFLY